ncbi:Alpha/Beta hydrolase protein [Phycomyces blakesleeanus]|uniref:Alpha/Beta hydrolase protein n=1 Tax=Phycomyces blakesleeanus TaxID=4837 RepID=A0ABR3AHU8_PHYBL
MTFDSSLLNREFLVPALEYLPLKCYLSGSPSQCSPLIILFHGTGGDHFQFDSLLPTLVQHKYCVLTIDLPYHGLSQPVAFSNPESPVTFESILENLDEVMKAYRCANPSSQNPIDLIIGGVSMGGMLAQICCDQRKTAWEEIGFSFRLLVPIGCSSTSLLWPRMEWMDYLGVMADDSPEKKSSCLRQGHASDPFFTFRWLPVQGQACLYSTSAYARRQ